MSNQATRLAEESKRLARKMMEDSWATGDDRAYHPARDELHAAIDALLALVQPAVSEEAPHLQTIREKLIRAGAKLPMENKGTIESAMAGGLSIALCVVEAEIDAARAQSSSKGDEGMQHE